MSLTIRTFILLILFTIPYSSSSADRPAGLEGVGVSEHLGAQVTIDQLHFQNEQGNPALLSTYFKPTKPVLLALVYYRCPHLCSLVLNGLLESMKTLEWTPGNQFELVAVSIDPKETPQLASDKKANYLRTYNRPHSESGWHFLTGNEDQIHSLASQVGFDYKYLEDEKQYSHAAVLFILTPQGKISRYLYGTTFKTQDLRLGLLEAASGRISSVVDRVLMFCFHFDPTRNSYTLKVWRIVQLVILLQVIVGSVLLFNLWKGERKGKLARP